MTSKEFYIGFKNNNQKVINEFYEGFSDKFKRVLRSKYNSVFMDEDFFADVYQDTIMRLWENIQYEKITLENLTSDIAAYLFGIGENVLREALRKKKEVSIEDLPELPDYTKKFITVYEINERNKAIRNLVDSMEEPCAPILLDFYWRGYSMEEIAIRWGYANANSAKTQKNKCMNKLKAIFKSL
jgi:RNA polymerase sigma factor (sigma-70 family)